MVQVTDPAESFRPAPGVLPARRRSAFTLVELLVVMAIAAVLLAFIGPAIVPRLTGTELTRGGQMLSDALSLARQQAVKSNSDVYVVFYQLPANGASAWRGIQVATLNRSTSPITIVPIGKVITLPNGVEISTATTTTGNTFSPPLVLQRKIVSGTCQLSSYGTASIPWQGFRFRADGSLDRDIKPTDAFLTVVSTNDNSKAYNKRNYYTVQINAVTGMVRTLRP